MVGIGSGSGSGSGRIIKAFTSDISDLLGIGHLYDRQTFAVKGDDYSQFILIN